MKFGRIIVKNCTHIYAFKQKNRFEVDDTKYDTFHIMHTNLECILRELTNRIKYKEFSFHFVLILYRYIKCLDLYPILFLYMR